MHWIKWVLKATTLSTGGLQIEHCFESNTDGCQVVVDALLPHKSDLFSCAVLVLTRTLFSHWQWRARAQVNSCAAKRAVSWLCFTALLIIYHAQSLTDVQLLRATVGACCANRIAKSCPLLLISRRRKDCLRWSISPRLEKRFLKRSLWATIFLLRTFGGFHCVT